MEENPSVSETLDDDDDEDHCSDSDLEELPDLRKGFVAASEIDPEKESKRVSTRATPMH